jgi:uncharacterized membrane protein YedE/YeeE
MELSDSTISALIGLAGGIVLGLAARVGRFCALGAVEDALYGGNLLRLRMWGLAAAVAIAGSFLAQSAGLFDPARSIYLSTPWSPVSTVLGGLMFGYGMALVGTCGYGALARLGGGDLRALVMVLVIGLSAYMAIGGLTALARVEVTAALALEPQSLASLAGAATGLPEMPLGLAMALPLAVWALSDAKFRRSSKAFGWATAAGGVIAGAWVASSWSAGRAFEPVGVHSYNFVSPVGDTLIYAMTSTGSTLDFGIGGVVGVALGAAMGSLWKGEFRWEACDDARELRRQILGAFLMGTGGVMALGCTVGQGLSALSVLAPSAPLAIVSIGLGAVLGLKMLVEGRIAA